MAPRWVQPVGSALLADSGPRHWVPRRLPRDRSVPSPSQTVHSGFMEGCGRLRRRCGRGVSNRKGACGGDAALQEGRRDATLGRTRWHFRCLAPHGLDGAAGVGLVLTRGSRHLLAQSTIERHGARGFRLRVQEGRFPGMLLPLFRETLAANSVKRCDELWMLRDRRRCPRGPSEQSALSGCGCQGRSGVSQTPRGSGGETACWASP